MNTQHCRTLNSTPLQKSRFPKTGAIGYDTPNNYRKRYYKGELPQKNTFATRELSPEPKFVRERRKKSDNEEDK